MATRDRDEETNPLLTNDNNPNDSQVQFLEDPEICLIENIVKRDDGSKVNLTLAILACILGSPFQIGLNTSILNSPQEIIEDFYNETYIERYGEPMKESLLTGLWSITVAFFCLGGMIGGLISGFLVSRIGRKNTLLLNNAFAFICAGLQVGSKYAKSYEMLIVGRVVGGINCGLNSAVAPLYLAEISPLAMRGFCGTCNQLSITLGVLLGQIIGLKSLLGTSDYWPIAVAFPALPAIFSLLTLTWCPKSPRFLLVNKEDDIGAEQALTWLRGGADVSEEMETMRKERTEMRNIPKFQLKELWINPELRWPMIICIVLQMSQQLSGINAVMYYSTSIFKSAGLEGDNPQYATIGAGSVNVLMTFISALIMDKAGRRTLHMIGLAGMCVFSVLLVICLALQDEASWLSYISILAVIVYIVFFATGPGSIPWFMVAEMFTQGPRSAAVSVSVMVNWLCNFTVGLVYPLLENAIKSYSFLPFSALLALFFIFTFFFVPETKGKTISEVTQIFKSPSTASDLSKSDIDIKITPYGDMYNAPRRRSRLDSIVNTVQTVDSQTVENETVKRPVKFE